MKMMTTSTMLTTTTTTTSTATTRQQWLQRQRQWRHNDNIYVIYAKYNNDNNNMDDNDDNVNVIYANDNAILVSPSHFYWLFLAPMLRFSQQIFEPPKDQQFSPKLSTFFPSPTSSLRNRCWSRSLHFPGNLFFFLAGFQLHQFLFSISVALKATTCITATWLKTFCLPSFSLYSGKSFQNFEIFSIVIAWT